MYFPKGDFPSDNFPSGNFPNVKFPKRQLPKGQVRLSEAPQAAKGPSAAAMMDQGRALRLFQTWEVAHLILKIQILNVFTITLLITELL